MTKQLQTNRYGLKTPVLIADNGCAISVPIYLSPTTEARKEALNRFREIKTQQMVERGINTDNTSSFGVSISTASNELTPIEQELGMNEEALRAVLFARGGIAETTLMKLSRLTGHVFASRDDVEAAYQLWLDEQYGTKTKQKRTKSTGTARQKPITDTSKDK